MIGDTLRVAVPPGVGDVYWALTKLKALKEREGAKAVRMYVQHSSLDRSRAWAGMVDFVDSAQQLRFNAPKERSGVGRMVGVDYVLWPNTVVDRGEHLREWMPELAMDLSFPVKTEDTGGPRIVVYPSSEAINKAWIPSAGNNFWPEVIYLLSKALGRVTIIGAAWDRPFYDRVLSGRDCGAEFLVGSTSLPQVADILKKARVLIGVASGMTIVANHFRTPCVALFPDAHHPRFPFTWVAPDAPYVVLRNNGLPSAQEVVSMALGIAR